MVSVHCKMLTHIQFSCLSVFFFSFFQWVYDIHKSIPNNKNPKTNPLLDHVSPQPARVSPISLLRVIYGDRTVRQTHLDDRTDLISQRS